MLQKVQEILETMPGLGLERMEKVKLMNRNDAKYIMAESQLSEFLNRLRGEYIIQTVNERKWQEYRTVYLDDRNHTMYLAHHNGHLARQKVRVRTYLDSKQLTFFEVKLKNNHGKTSKKRMKVSSLDSIADDGAGEFLAGIAMLPIPLADMIPTVENHFERITLVNRDMVERMTIDTGLSFHNLETGMTRRMNNMVIVEVKYEGRSGSVAKDILRDMRVHPSGFSKYCIGSALTNPSLKHNRFNLRIRKINKILTR